MALINNVAFSDLQAQRLNNFRKIIENARNLDLHEPIPPILKPYVEDIEPSVLDEAAKWS